MTLALIAVIAFFALGFLHKARLSAKKKNYKKRTKTNVELQKQIGAAVDAIVTTEIERLILSGASKIEAIEMLYGKHIMPLADDIADSSYSGYAYVPGVGMKTDEDIYGKLRFNLIYFLTKKEMRRLGYAYSFDGKESKWQEKQNRNDRFDDIKNKYPWL